MKITIKLLLLVLCMALPMSAIAMSYDDKEKHGEMKMSMGHDADDKAKMDHDSDDMAKMDHDSMDSMEMGGAKIPLGMLKVDGIEARAYLLDVREAMAKHGMKMTHHLMVEFVDADSGKALTKGRAAVKVRKGEGKESKAHKMMRMDGAFGTDLMLADDGHYQFRIGTKLGGEKRTFEFEYGMMSHK